MRQRNVVIIGAGVVGTLAALRLLREGHRVVLVDPEPPGSGASSGNAGCFSPSSIVPLSLPGMLTSIPKWLLNPVGPLVFRRSYLFQAAPWLYRFVQAGRMHKVERHAMALHSLINGCLPVLLPVLQQIGAQDLVRTNGSLVVYRDEQSWKADRLGRELRRRSGIVWDELDRDALLAFQPDLTPNLFSGLFFPGNGHTVDPQRLVEAVAEAFVRQGGTVLRDRVIGFEFAEDRLRALSTASGRVPGDTAIVAAGAFSRPLARELGHRLPLETERGYHAMVKDPGIAPSVPVLDATGKFVATPMAGGLRLTGTVEFGGLSAAPDWRHARNLLALGKTLYPSLANTGRDDMASLWMGHRPSLPDSLPVVGWSRRSRDVAFAFGHGHLGMTGAPMTSELVADLVAGRPASIDISAFSPERFSGEHW